MSRYIIGGGIAGLICAFYNPEYKIISDKFGGQMSVKGMGPRMLEVNDNSARLLEDLGKDLVKIKEAKVGYMVRGKFLDKMNEEQRKQYYLKSRDLKKASSVPSSIMSDGKNSFSYFDIDMDILTDEIFEKINKKRIIKSNAKSIDTSKKTVELENGTTLNYEHIISTIPAPIFFKISNMEPDEPFESASKLFVVVHKNNIDIRDYDYIYIPDPTIPHHRISKINDHLVSIEFTTSDNPLKFLDKWTSIMWRHHILKNVQIKKGKVKKIKGITFAGRYACWDHDIKTDDIVYLANEIKTLNLLKEEL